MLDVFVLNLSPPRDLQGETHAFSNTLLNQTSHTHTHMMDTIFPAINVTMQTKWWNNDDHGDNVYTLMRLQL